MNKWMCGSETRNRRESSGAHMVLAAPGHCPVTRMYRHCLLLLCTLALLASTSQTSCSLPVQLCVCLSAFPWVHPVLGIPACLTSPCLQPTAFFRAHLRCLISPYRLPRPLNSAAITSFLKVIPHQSHTTYLKHFNSHSLIVPLELCFALLYFALKIFAECSEIIVWEPVLNSRTSFSFSTRALGPQPACR